jgi:hypothetical protein
MRQGRRRRRRILQLILHDVRSTSEKYEISMTPWSCAISIQSSERLRLSCKHCLPALLCFDLETNTYASSLAKGTARPQCSDWEHSEWGGGGLFSVRRNKKFWEELIAYFPLIRHGPHRKRNNYVDTQRQAHRQQGDLIIYRRNFGEFYRAVA